MRFNTKIAVVVREDLMMWQKPNVTAFIVSGIAGLPDILGEPYIDGSENVYLPMIKQPIMIFSATGGNIQVVYEKALAHEVQMCIYTEDLFSTPHDLANRAAVRTVISEELNLVGLALYGKKKDIDKLMNGLKLHP